MVTPNETNNVKRFVFGKRCDYQNHSKASLGSKSCSWTSRSTNTNSNDLSEPWDRTDGYVELCNGRFQKSPVKRSSMSSTNSQGSFSSRQRNGETSPRLELQMDIPDSLDNVSDGISCRSLSPPGPSMRNSFVKKLSRRNFSSKKLIVNGSDSNDVMFLPTLSRRRSSSKAIQKLPLYVSNYNWEKLSKFLSTDEGKIQLTTYANASKRATSTRDVLAFRTEVNLGDTGSVLHVVCQGHPPLNIISKICDENPTLICCTNNPHCHTPLHVAAAWGAHPSIIKYLLEKAPQNAIVRDIFGRTPLNLHLQFCQRHGSCDPSSFSDQEHMAHREKMQQGKLNLTMEDDAFDRMVCSNGFRSYGPIPQVVEILKYWTRIHNKLLTSSAIAA